MRERRGRKELKLFLSCWWSTEYRVRIRIPVLVCGDLLGVRVQVSPVFLDVVIMTRALIADTERAPDPRAIRVMILGVEGGKVRNDVV